MGIHNNPNLGKPGVFSSWKRASVFMIVGLLFYAIITGLFLTLLALVG